MCRSALFVVIATLAGTAQQGSPAIPNFHDLTIKTRVTRGLNPPSVTVLRLKGARERTETGTDSPNALGPYLSRITQCDQETHLTLFERQKSFRRDYFRLPPAPHLSGLTGASGVMTVPVRAIGPADGVIVTVKFESVDTGEHRQMGGYEEHHIKTTITVDPGKGAAAKKSKTKIDGWYLDLPGYPCDRPITDPRMQFASIWHLPMRPGGHDRFVFQYEGTSPRGYTVEETSTEKSAGNVLVNKTELVEVSDAALDEALFDVPPDFTLAPDPRSSNWNAVPASTPPSIR